MTAVIVGDAGVAADIFGLFERAGLPAVRVAVADAAHAEVVAQADVIVDACSLPLESKRELFSSLAKCCSHDAILCSDESVVPRHELLDGIDREFRRRFAICHFFIPTANLTLVEMVTGDEMDPKLERQLTDLLERQLQRNVLKCPDTPGFIANRIGLFFAFRSVLLAADQGMRPDQADRILAARFGVPRLGAFGLFDLVGFDVMVSIAENLMHRLPSSDAWRGCDFRKNMLLGNARDAAGAGGLRFYRKDKTSGERKALDLNAHDFVSCSDDVIDPNREAEFVARLESELGAYCTKVAESTGVVPDAIDEVLCKGFAWRQGPFALLNRR